MYKTISNIVKQSTNLLSDITKNVSTAEKKKSSSFYDDYLERSAQKKHETEFAIKKPTLKLPDLTAQETQPVSANYEAAGSVIKKNIKNVLSKKYGELDTRNLFNDIDDKDVEDNISTAKNAISTNISKGFLNKDYSKKLPNLLGGLALSYAAANKGNNKEATRAREAAYSEDDSLIKDTGIKILSNEISKPPYVEKTTNKKSNVTNPVSSTNEKFDISLPSNHSEQNVPKTGIRFKAEVNKANSDSYNTPKFEEFKPYAQKNGITAELQKQASEKNTHQLNNVSNEQEKFYEISKKEGITAAHAQIKTYAEQWKDVPEYKWTMGDIAKWKTTGGEKFIHQEKLGFIKNYKDVILDAAEKYDIPPILLAGVAYIEYGGAPMWIDDAANSVRSFDWSGPEWVDKHLTITKNPDLTSFGNMSIQVRRALEMLGYDASTSKRDDVIDSLKDPIQNIYLAASHLNILRNIDFKGKSKNDLTENEIKIIASRYNLGPDIALNSIVPEYGDRIYNNKDDILNALS